MTRLIERIERRRLRRALNRLTQTQRDVFIATSREGRTIAQIAERMGIATAEAEHLLADAIIGLHRDLSADRCSIRNGSISDRWTRLRHRLSARLRQGRSRS